MPVAHGNPSDQHGDAGESDALSCREASRYRLVAGRGGDTGGHEHRATLSSLRATIRSVDTSSFAALVDLPSAAPLPVDWDTVEPWLGLSLPGDYKALATTYGPLDIGEFVWLHTPCIQEDRFDYATWLRETHRHCRISSRNAPPYEPPAFHPMPGGLLAWGETRASAYLFWDTAASDDPDQWPVVVFHEDAAIRGIAPWHSYEMPLLDTLSAAIRTGLPLPGSDRLGPLPATARRMAFLPDAAHGTRPRPVVRRYQRRSGAAHSPRGPGWRRCAFSCLRPKLPTSAMEPGSASSTSWAPGCPPSTSP